MHNNQVNSSISFLFQPDQMTTAMKNELDDTTFCVLRSRSGLRSATIVHVKTLCEYLKRKPLLHYIVGERIISGCGMTDC
jgi:hypothetical protein